MYKLIKNQISGQINQVQRLSDNAFIPLNTGNTDYQKYLKWLEEGNTPEAAE
jgi:hypothetical protein